MTVSTEVTRVIVEGNGVTTSFSYSFPIPGSSATDQTNAELILLAADGTTTVLADNLWSITGVDTGVGGTFVYNPGSPVTTGNFLTLNRILPYEQTTTLSAQGAYSPAVVEAALDNLAFQTEQLNTRLLQAVRAPITDAALNELPTEILRANRYLAFDASGQPTVSGVLNTASGFLIVETASANVLAPASVLNFVNAVTAVETVSGRVDLTITSPLTVETASSTATSVNTILFATGANVTSTVSGRADVTITAAAGGSTDQIQYNNGSGLGGITFSGDVTVAVPGGTASLSTTGAVAGTYTNATLTVDAKGRLSTASSGATGAGALVFVEGHTAANSASLDFTTGISDTYSTYKLIFDQVLPATDNRQIQLLVSQDGGTTWLNSGYGWSITYTATGGSAGDSANAADSKFDLGDGISNAAPVVADLTINGMRNTAGNTLVVGLINEGNSGGANYTLVSFGGRIANSGNKVNALRLIIDSGNITSGTAALYGLASA